MSTPFRALLPFFIVLVLLVGVTIGLQLAPMAGHKPSMFAASDLNRLEEILNHIDYNYVDTINTNALMQDLVSEYLDREEVIDDIFKRLDPHSNYIPAETLRAETENLEGRFEGIGIEFNIIRDTILVVSPITGGPSEELGIQSGDKIITVEDSLVAGVGISDNKVRKLLRGPKGTKVRVGIFRQGEPELLDFEITRDQIPLFSIDVSYMVDEEIGYISLNRFSATTVEEFYESLDKLVDAGMRKLILDLRGNPGGYLMAATRVTDEFLSGKKMIVYTEGKATRRDEYRSGKIGAFERGDMVVLIDEGSASASEIVAGALQDHDRAAVVGRRSFGKGLVQEIYGLADSSAIRLTVARYYTPDGRCIQRAYDDGVDAYYEDYLARLQTGGEVSDSIRDLAQQGYGIIPDLVIPMDTSEDRRAFNRLYNQGFVSRFAYDLYSRERQAFQEYSGVEQFLATYAVPEHHYEQFLERIAGEEVDADQLDRIRPRLETAIAAQVARQIWKNEGFYPVFHRLDNDFLKAYELLRTGRAREVADL